MVAHYPDEGCDGGGGTDGWRSRVSESGRYEPFFDLGSHRMIQARRVLRALRYELRAGRIILRKFPIRACHTQLDSGHTDRAEETARVGVDSMWGTTLNCVQGMYMFKVDWIGSRRIRYG